MAEVAEASRLLTSPSREAADRLGVEPDTIRHLAKTSVLPPIRYGPRGLFRFRVFDSGSCFGRASPGFCRSTAGNVP